MIAGTMAFQAGTLGFPANAARTDAANSFAQPQTFAGAIVLTPVTVAALPSAATAGAGARMFVSDANATTFASVVAGGGANPVPVYSDGTAWRIG